MDPLVRMQLQTDVAKFRERTRKDPEITMLLQGVTDALKARDWEKAKQRFEEAKAAFTPERKVVDIIVDAGKAVSKAEARRYIQRGAVKVDGVQLRKVDATVSEGQQVTFRNAPLQG